jgi:2-oxoglutarate ferredoxin oxidoreductase subunit gamma
MTNTQNHKQRKKEIIITGFGGQGIILAGFILGKAAAIGEHMESTLVQSYGPESRGGSCSAQVVISDEIIHYPYVNHPDILVCMSQSGYDKLIKQMKQKGTLIIDKDLVRPSRGLKYDFFSIPATRMAEELGRTMIANIVMLGFLTAVTDVISMDSAQMAIGESVPKGTEELNSNAFKKGHDYGLATLKGRQKKATGQAGAIS